MFGGKGASMTDSSVLDKKISESFPIIETFEDVTGVEKTFVSICTKTVSEFSYSVSAKEKDKENGYEFAVYTDTDPFVALGDLRQKIRRGLSTKFLTNFQGKPMPRFDELEGRISYGGVVVDGNFISFEDFSEMLQTYEGFNFDIKLHD